MARSTNAGSKEAGMTKREDKRRDGMARAITRGLRTFGYQDLTVETVRECVDAYYDEKPMPPGVIGAFVEGMIEDAEESEDD